MVTNLINLLHPMKRNAKLLFLLALVSFLLADYGFSQTHGPKREFRAVWVATVSNMDFPSHPGLNEAEFTKEWIALTEFFKGAGFNAIIAQIRPAADAFYPSGLAPWSKYLSGRQGQAPQPFYDPLEIMIREAHLRGLEFHAWLNPFRASVDLDTLALADTHPLKLHPEWGVQYGKKIYFNPGLPQVRNYLTEIVEEILVHYDVDAIHFDDYFYPYKIKGEVFLDSLEFAHYGFGFSKLEDWRRNNVNLLIEQISKKIKGVSPHVKFGISPFGVWRNADKDPVNGSNTQASQTSYDDLYADILKWLEMGWIDYVAPQIYWNIGFQVADYETLVKWWSDHCYDRNLYIGQAAYKIAKNGEDAWHLPSEIPKQIQLNRSDENVSGSIFFNASAMLKNPLGLMDSLRHDYFAHRALLPELHYLESEEPIAPAIYRKVYFRNGVAKLKWTSPPKKPLPAYYVVYRFEDVKPGDFNDPRAILAILPFPKKRTVTFLDDSVEKGKTYSYVVTALNRLNEESDLSNWKTIQLKKKRIKRIH